MLAQSKFSHKELMGVNNDQKQEMLFSKHGINWNDIDQGQKTGFVCYKEFIADEYGGIKKWSIHSSPRSRDDLDRLIQSVLIKDGD